MGLVKKSFSAGYYWLGCLAILIVQDVVSAFRWKILLEIKTGTKLPALSMIRLTWIGLFFNSFLPGAVTGDFIKLLYAKDLDPKLTKTYLVTSVLLDRIIGLIGLLFYWDCSQSFILGKLQASLHRSTSFFTLTHSSFLE